MSKFITFFALLVVIIAMISSKINNTECSAAYQDEVFIFFNEYENDTFIGNDVKQMKKSFISGDNENFHTSWYKIAEFLEDNLGYDLSFREHGLRYYAAFELLQGIA